MAIRPAHFGALNTSMELISRGDYPFHIPDSTSDRFISSLERLLVPHVCPSPSVIAVKLQRRSRDATHFYQLYLPAALVPAVPSLHLIDAHTGKILACWDSFGKSQEREIRDSLQTAPFLVSALSS